MFRGWRKSQGLPDKGRQGLLLATGVGVLLCLLLASAVQSTWAVQNTTLPSPKNDLGNAFTQQAWDPLVEALKALWDWLVPKPFGLLFGAVFGWLGRIFVSRRPSRLLLNFRDPKSLNIVIGSPVNIVPHTSQTHPQEGVPFFGFGPLFAFHRLTQLLTSAYPFIKRYEVTTSRTFSRSNLKRDLLLLGWPGGNEITAMVVSDLSLPLKWQDRDLVDATTGAVLFSATVSNNLVTEDIGVIIRAKNPYFPNSVVMILAGGESYGVLAAAAYLKTANLSRIRRIPIVRNATLASLCDLAIPLKFKAEYFLVVVKTKVRGHFTSEPEIVGHYKLG